MLTIKAPAKINLTLEVLGKRPDGFHELCSVFQTIDLYDTLYIQAGQGFTFECDMPGWEAEKSLVRRVLDLLPVGNRGGVNIKIEKRIPLMSGLGGDSSDAAALLKGLNKFWQMKLSEQDLHQIALQLGSDVPYFLKGGTALVEGRGEKLTPLPPLKKLWIVVVVPNILVEQGKTAKMYAALKPSSFSDGSLTIKLIEKIKKGENFDSEILTNTFEDLALEMYDNLGYVVLGCIRLGVNVHLTGAGPALFAVFNNKAEAEIFYKVCQSKTKRVKAYLTETV
jgi:4-diphosphocytidyl-2-C-methyl-D-erythritol kinase